jgi:hypothetical protein
MPRPLTAMLLGPLFLATAAVPAEFLRFEVGPANGGVGVYGNGVLLCRTRSDTPASFDPHLVAARLTDCALAGLRAGEVQATGNAAGARITARGQLILAVDKATARAARSTPQGLAETWATALRRLLARPYVALAPADRLLVPVGDRRLVAVGGTAKQQVAFSSLAPDVATVETDLATGQLTVRGVAKGSTVVVGTVPGGKQYLLTVDVKFRAAWIADSFVAQISNPPLPDDDLRRVLRNAALMATRPGPGAQVQLTEPVPLGAGYALDVRADGPDLIPAAQTVTVSVRKIAAPAAPTRELLVSNQPERITTPGVVLRERLLGTGPVRLLWHHVNNYRSPLRYVVRIANRSPEPASLHVIDAIMGPGTDEIFVGHSALARFLQLWEQGEGYVLQVPGNRMVELYDVRLAPSLITSGLMRLAPLATRDLVVEVAAEDSWPADAYFVPVPGRLANDPPLTPYRFEGEKNVSLRHEVGGPWTFYHIGKDYSQNLQGYKLLGDYGVQYRLATSFSNPTARPARCEIALRASGGVARATVIVDGETVETGVLQGAREQVIHKFALGPGEQRQVQLRTIPESGSNYPITLMLRSTQ